MTLEFVTPCAMDLDYIAANLRAADKAEMLAMSYGEADGAHLQRAVRLSIEATVALVDGEPACVFGLGAGSMLLQVARPWMLGTPLVEANRMMFLRANRAQVANWASRWHLENWVDARHHCSVRWLRWLGFTLDEAIPFGPLKIPFHRFEMRRSECATQ